MAHDFAEAARIFGQAEVFAAWGGFVHRILIELDRRKYPA